MFHYFSYFGKQSVGAVLHALNVYCTSNYREHCQIGDGKIILGGKTVADYTWEGVVPVFNFQDEEFMRNQYIFKPFLGNMNWLNDNITYVIQQLKNEMNIHWALHLIKIRRKGESPIAFLLEADVEKFKNIMRKDLMYFTEEDIDKYFDHFMFCAIYEL